MTINAERDISYVLVSNGIQVGDGSSSCLSDLSRIEKLTIPDFYEEDNKKVVSIGTYAFGKNNAYQCNIGELILSNNLLTIDSYAFSSSIIDNITFPKSLSEVKEAAFHSAKFKNISFKYSNENIFIKSANHFSMSIINNIILPKNIKEIPKGFLWGATVQNFHIPASVVKINNGAFCYTYKFDKITSDSPNYVVHNGILYSSDYRTLIKYPSNCYIDILPTVTEISDCGGFSGFSHTNFVLKNKIRKFGFACFGYCFSMITCDLSSSMATIMPLSMFYHNNKLEKVIFPKTN